MRFETYPDRDMLAIEVANRLAGELKQSLMVHDWASFVVPGGSTPGPVFDALCAADLDWARVHVMLSDERWVPEDHARSNAALIKSRLMVDRAAAAQFTPFYDAAQTLENRAAHLADTLAAELPLSLLVLGMGDDMHTASLFPGAPGLEAALAPDAPAVVPVHVAGQEPRISLSGHVLAGALSKHLVIFGAAKKDAFERAQTLAPTYAPIRAVMDELTVHWAE